MSISVKDQYFFSFGLPGVGDLIPEDLFKSFKMIEEAGNILPSYRLNFESPDYVLVSKLNEINYFTVRFGKDEKSSVIGTFAIQMVARNRSGQDHFGYTAAGLSTALPYVNNPGTRMTGRMSALQAIASVVPDHFEADIDPDVSSDSQLWVQAGRSDRTFVQDLWMHARIEAKKGKPTAPVIGITTTNRFILRDLKGLAEQKPKYKFGLGSGCDVPILANYGYSHTSGLVNAWLGYGRTQMVTDFDRGGTTVIQSQAVPLISKAKFNMTDKCLPRTDDMGFLCGNVDKLYNQTALDNARILALHSTSKVRVMFKNVFVPVQVLDPVMFFDPGPREGLVIRSTSGKYIVTKVVRSVSRREFRTIVEMCRESQL